MTQLLSTIFNEIDFKMRCIAHFKKVAGKMPNDSTLQVMMRDQTYRSYLEIKTMLAEAKTLGKRANKLVKKYDIKEWLDLCLIRPSTAPALGPENQEMMDV